MTTTDRLTMALADRYRIERQLGAGGMATVYLAEDLKHKRKVALKVLRPELAAVLGAERFVQEITTTAALQHPHILPLFDSGTADGFLFYVMPYIEGETLRDRLNRETQLGIEDAVRITREVADALDYAHRHGVIHRDIKPENILLHDGRPMVADFGIALAVSAAAGGRMTETGMSLGTPHYMSPEQATADKDITARSDVYSLGTVLYEMLTGEPPHMGNSAQAIIMKIVTEEAAPVTKLRKSVPPNVTAAVAKALEKVPADRFDTARAFADALGNPGYTAPHVGVGRASTPTANRVPWIVAGASGLITLLLAGVLWSGIADTPPGAPVAWVTELVLPDEAGFRGGLAIARDASFVVYGSNGIWMRRADAEHPTLIAGTEGGCCPALSRDGERVAFVRRGAVHIAPVIGGTSALAGSGISTGDDITWLGDATIIGPSADGGGLLRVAAGGGPSQPFTMPDTAAGELEHWSPRALPGERGVVFTIVPRSSTGETGLQIGVVGPEGGAHRVLMPGRVAAYAPPGYLLVTRADAAIVAVPFDLDERRITGDPVQLMTVPGAPGTFTWRGYAAVADNGTLVFVGGTDRELELVWRDPAGRVALVDSNPAPGMVQRVAVSPDGNVIAYELLLASSSRVIEVLDLRTGARARIADNGVVAQPSFSADGRSVVFTLSASGRDGVYRAALGRLGEFAPVAQLPVASRVELSGDMRWLYYTTGDGTSAEIVRRSLEDSGTTDAVVVSGVVSGSPRVSPDGRWVAFLAEEQGMWQLMLRSTDPARTERWSVFRANGWGDVAWSGNGRQLYFVASGALRGARLAAGDAPVVERVDSLFAMDGYYGAFAAAPGGRFLLARWKGAAGGIRLGLVSDWRGLLRGPR